MPVANAKASTTPDRCPYCKKGKIRIKVELFLDIPATSIYHLNKQVLRSRDIRIDGANWPKLMMYCTHPGCGMIEKRGK